MHTPDLTQLLRERFGFESFRPGQERIVRDLLSGRDVLAVLPTAAGKSLPFQLAAQLLPGLTLVVSPLLALMKDQVESLIERGLDAGALSGTQSDAALSEALESETTSKLVYVTPERFANEEFMARVIAAPVSLFVVDEAHSISQWGHGFRPSYLRLEEAINRFRSRPVVLALTATATPWVRADIVDRLGLRNPDAVVTGVDRPNLFFEVERVEEEYLDRRALKGLLIEREQAPLELRDLMDGSGIVYSATVRGAEEAAAWLREWGISSDTYHGRRKKSDRDRVQDRFLSGEVRVIAATNAFGLGVDKPDVRFVIHRDIPASLESYYQEAGRAGRDGEPARCTLIYRPADLGRAAFLAGGGELTREEVERAHAGLVRQRAGTLRELQAATGLGQADLMRLLSILSAQGCVEQRRGRFRLLVNDFDPEQVPLEGEQRRRAYERSRLEMMRGYAELRECRRRYILNYFGEEYPRQWCGWCDLDLERPRESPRPLLPSAPFGVGQRVRHPGWGEGIVQRVTPDSVVVLFEEAGYKTLDTDLSVSKGLLHAL